MESKKENNQFAHAPYNFVPFPEDVIERYKSYSDLPAHDASNSIGKQLLNGEITFDIVAQTPIFVGDGGNEGDKPLEFVTNAKGEYEIPGSTLKGLLRQTVAVLSLSNWTSKIDDERFYYRGVAGKNEALRKDYKNILDIKVETIHGKSVSIARKVQAGYIVKQSNNQYVIYPAKTDGGRHGKSYYKCHLKDFKSLQQDIETGFKIKEATFSVNEHGKVTHLNDGKGNFKGKLVFSGPMTGKDPKKRKKTAYVINEIDLDYSKVIKIEQKELKAYQADYDFRCKKFGQSKEGLRKQEFFKLPEKIGLKYAKPCFYIYHDSRLYFGFTAYLRLTYEYSTKDLLPKNLNLEGDGIDYTSSLFGFSNKGKDEASYASRLTFLSAKAMPMTKTEQSEVSQILGQPRASALNMYLINTLNETHYASYNDSNSQLRGGKQYWIRKEAIPTNKNLKNKKVATTFKPLGKGIKFRAKIRFDQLYEDELGLLLWSLQAPSYQQIGLAKPYGYGVVKFKNIECRVTTNEKMYQNLSSFFDIGLEKVDIQQYIQKYKDYVKSNFDKEIDQLKNVSTFLKMKEISPLSKKEMDYMTLEEYQSGVILPTAQALLNNEKEKFRNFQKKTSTNHQKNIDKRDNTRSKHNQRKDRKNASSTNQNQKRMTYKPFAQMEELKNLLNKK